MPVRRVFPRPEKELHAQRGRRRARARRRLAKADGRRKPSLPKGGARRAEVGARRRGVMILTGDYLCSQTKTERGVSDTSLANSKIRRDSVKRMTKIQNTSQSLADPTA